jgi:NAD(P)-dependent dehydrogenase (short-subunit alcohol dehydrogenase family)
MTKAALDQLTRYLAMEWAGDGASTPSIPGTSNRR